MTWQSIILILIKLLLIYVSLPHYFRHKIHPWSGYRIVSVHFYKYLWRSSDMNFTLIFGNIYSFTRAKFLFICRNTKTLSPHRQTSHHQRQLQTIIAFWNLCTDKHTFASIRISKQIYRHRIDCRIRLSADSFIFRQQTEKWKRR
jgi:hypothetical protein